MRINRWQIFTLLVGAALAVGVVIGQGVNRFQHLSTETSFPQHSGIGSIEVYHDTASGQEFMCVFGDDATLQGYKYLSCIPTGRNWK